MHKTIRQSEEYVMANEMESPTQMVILQDELNLHGKKGKYEIKVTESSITYTLLTEKNNNSRTASLNFKDIIGCDCMKGQSTNDTNAYLTMYAYPHKKKIIGKKTARVRETLVVTFNRRNSFEENQNEAKVWKAAVSALINGDSVTSVQDIVTLPQRSPKKMLVLVNPFSGPGKALQIFQQKVVPIFAEAGLHFDMIITERQNHALEFVKSMPLDQWYGVVIVSGDGLIYEVVNGLMQRPDWEEAIKTPLGCLPGGSGNALCCSIDRECGEPWNDNPALHSSFIIAKHRVVPMDLVAVETSKGRSYSFLSVTWGLISDIDIESERFRKLGAVRFTVEAVAKVINLKAYHGRLWYLPIEGEAGKVHRPGLVRSSTLIEPVHSRNQLPPRSTSVVNMPFQNGESDTSLKNGDVSDSPSEDCDLERIDVNDENDDELLNGEEDRDDSPKESRSDTRANPAGNDTGVKLDLPPLNKPVPSNWSKIEDDFVHVSACYQSLIGPDTMMTPDGKLNDGVIYLCFTRIANTNKKQLASHLVNMESGSHMKDPSFEVVKVKAFRIEPITPTGHISVDGEEVPYGPIQAQVLPGLARVMSL